MTRVRIAGLVLLVLLGAGLFVRITDRAGVPPKKTDRMPMEISAYQTLPVTETVDLRNGSTPPLGETAIASDEPRRRDARSTA